MCVGIGASKVLFGVKKEHSYWFMIKKKTLESLEKAPCNFQKRREGKKNEVESLKKKKKETKYPLSPRNVVKFEKRQQNAQLPSNF